MMSTASLAAALIRVFEGCRLEAYEDSGGVWTIGFGHTFGVKQGMTCTPDEADAWLSEDAKPLLDATATLPGIAAAAYVSFGYNCGKARDGIGDGR